MIGVACCRRQTAWRAAGLALVLLGCAGWHRLHAEVRPYTLEIPDGEPVSFKVEFRVEHPGTLGIQVEWSGPRILSFRLKGPGPVHRARRSGPSPQRIQVKVYPQDLAELPWMLSIRALPGRGAGSGTLTLELPDAPEVEAKLKEEAAPPPPPSPQPEPWAVVRRPPRSASEQQTHLFEAVENFRQQVVAPDGTFLPDACRWQADLLRYLADWRDLLSETGETPPISSRRYLGRLVEAIRRVDEVRSSEDPILAGPVPEERMRRRAWLALRRQKIRPLERELDALGDALRGGHAPELEGETWPGRLISCVAACERHFEQRIRLGVEEATNYDLAQAQWEPILAVTEALKALVYLSSEGAAAEKERKGEPARPRGS